MQTSKKCQTQTQLIIVTNDFCTGCLLLFGIKTTIKVKTNIFGFWSQGWCNETKITRLLQWQYGMEVRITSRFLAKDTMPNFRLKKQTAMQLHPQGNLLRDIVNWSQLQLDMLCRSVRRTWTSVLKTTFLYFKLKQKTILNYFLKCE